MSKTMVASKEDIKKHADILLEAQEMLTGVSMLCDGLVGAFRVMAPVLDKLFWLISQEEKDYRLSNGLCWGKGEETA